MSNFNLETNRKTAIENIPRLTFQLPQSTTGANPSTTTPILFCQIGCQLDFQFKDISSAKLTNNGTYFTITPTDNSENYINWNGSGANGQKMIRFDLKEILFSAPAKDVVNSINYNRSIQFYLTFVNTTYPNIMIVITIIGQANNVGNALTNGFVLMNSLTPQIPLKNEIKNVTNLKNVNLGNLLPTNKSFFSTLIDTNSIQYISMTRIINIPQIFLDTLISRVLNGPDDYASRVNKYTQQIPSNPQGTIIFYTENIQPINSDQAIVCNANCDQVVGSASLIQPEIGTTSTVRGAKTSSRRTPTSLDKKVPGEECEEELVYPGSRTAVNVKNGGSSTSAATSTDIPLTPEETNKSMGLGALIGIFITLIIVCGIGVPFFFLTKSAELSFLGGIFSKELWLNRENIPWIIVAFIAFLAFTSCFIAALFKMNEEFNKKDTEHKIKIKSWELTIIGVSIWIVCIIILFLQSKFSFGKNRNKNSSNSYGNSSNSSDIQRLDNLRSNIIKDYSSNPSVFATPESSGSKKLLEASKIYNSLPSDQKAKVNKNNPDLERKLASASKLIQTLDSQSKKNSSNLTNVLKESKELNQIIKSISKNPIVTPTIKSEFKSLQMVENGIGKKNLKGMNLKVGEPVPPGLIEYVKE
jgi:uncharacterized membrane protein